MIIKPSISFLNDDNDAQLIIDVTSILTGMTGNASYPTPAPTLPVIQAALTQFSAALAEASNGGITLTAIKNDKREALCVLVRSLAGYVQIACKGDLTILLTSNLPIQKPQRFPIGDLPTPTGVLLVRGIHTGQLDAGLPPMFGASVYNWRLTAVLTPNVVLQTGQTTAASTSFTGLTPGTIYSVDVNAVGAAGPSDWSERVSQMAV